MLEICFKHVRSFLFKPCMKANTISCQIRHGDTCTFLFVVRVCYVTAMKPTKVYLQTFGCATNQADSEALAGCLAHAGYELVDAVDEADVLVYNTCAVKGPTENRVVEALKRAASGKKIIVAGCLPLINFDRLQREVRFDAVVGPAVADRIAHVVQRVLSGEKIVDLGPRHELPSLSLPRVRFNPVVSVLPVSYGCLGACAYCCVVFARGKLRSYSVGSLVEQVKQDLAVGVKEFWITSQDVGCYGKDLGIDVADLLQCLCKVDGDFKVRVGMMTPNTIIGILDSVVAAYGNEKIFKFIHLPVQSGDDETLKQMRRLYTVADFRRVVQAFRRAYPEVTLSTDVICGFPGETRVAFEKTLSLVEELKPDIVNVSKFFPRPGTLAANLRRAFLDREEIKRRSAEAAQLAKQVAHERNERWVGWVGDALVEEKGKKPETWVARNFAYKPIVVHSAINLLGKRIRAEIVQAKSTYLIGKIV